MKYFKSLMLTIATVLLFSFSTKINAKTYYISNNSNKDYWITYFHENGDNFGKELKANKLLIINPINFTPIGEGYGPYDTSEIKKIYIFESNKDIQKIDNKFINYIAKIKNDPELEYEIIAVETGLIIITSTKN